MDIGLKIFMTGILIILASIVFASVFSKDFPKIDAYLAGSAGIGLIVVFAGLLTRVWR